MIGWEINGLEIDSDGTGQMKNINPTPGEGEWGLKLDSLLFGRISGR